MAPNPNDAVFKYLQQQNRPYSANDILMNMHKEFGKTQIQKSLDQLVEEGKIKEKVYGKQKVYSITQDDGNTENMAKELQELDAQYSQTTEQLRVSDLEFRAAETKLRELTSLPTTENAIKELNELQLRVDNLKKKLNELSTSTIQISAEDKEKIVKNHEAQTKEWRKRKRLCMEMVNSILDGYPKDKKTLMEEVGIETDEDAGIAPL